MCNEDRAARYERRSGEVAQLCTQKGIAAIYRGEANWVGPQAVLVEVVRDTARCARGELVVLQMPARATIG